MEKNRLKKFTQVINEVKFDKSHPAISNVLLAVRAKHNIVMKSFNSSTRGKGHIVMFDIAKNPFDSMFDLKGGITIEMEDAKTYPYTFMVYGGQKGKKSIPIFEEKGVWKTDLDFDKLNRK